MALRAEKNGLHCFLLVLCFLSSASSSCEPSYRDLLNLAFSSVSGFYPPPQSDCLREIRLSFQNLSGAVSWMHLRNITTLQTLDLSGNALEGSIPGAFWSAPALIEVNLAENHLGGPLRFDGSSLRFLNLSSNRFTGAPDLSREFPGDFPAVDELRFLNVSLNNLTGVASLDFLQKFGSAAFVEAGVLTDESPPTKNKKRAGGGYGDFGSAVALTLYYARRRCGTRKGRTEEKDVEATAEVGWVAAARWGAAVVIFEKPLMELTFADLAAATSGFGRESLMAEAGRNGPVYRAVLPGDMHVVRSYFYEYMERGDLHRWLHELPAARPNTED
ncbi:hypothetical protein HPP92_019610 [Vanilla planifolia]|uniref:Uncharacterized protein n=1 Tax=Vanilla planifolia TaxID=51239 RepID=A0A835UN21_VANPL|nr:hypothetical protein HPP92_019610 [Vanilla planifolia]